MIYDGDLKIEFRAVPFSNYHALQYRISPDQDLTYEIEKSFLGFKYTKKRKYDTSWKDIYKFLNYPGAYKYDEDSCWIHYLLKDYKEFNEIKNSYHTYGEFFNYLDDKNDKEKKNWLKEKIEKYNDLHSIWS